jgi:hypothetical protein
MIEPLVEIILELILQLLGEVLIEFGLQSAAKPSKRQPNPWVAGFGYLMLGATLGGLCLLLLRGHLVGPAWRVVNLAITPVVAGLCMTAIGAWRAKRGDPVLRIDRFAYAYLFALSFALIRFWFAN